MSPWWECCTCVSFCCKPIWRTDVNGSSLWIELNWPSRNTEVKQYLVIIHRVGNGNDPTRVQMLVVLEMAWQVSYGIIYEKSIDITNWKDYGVERTESCWRPGNRTESLRWRFGKQLPASYPSTPQNMSTALYVCRISPAIKQQGPEL